MRAIKHTSRYTAAVLVFSLATPLAAQMPNFPSFPRRADPAEFQAPPPSATAQARWRAFYTTEGLLGRTDSRVIPDAYLAILERWAAGPELATLDLLTEFEARLDRSDPCFVAVQNRNLEELASLSPGSLAPVLTLHTFAWHHHLTHGRFNFLASTTRRVERWARLHVQTAADEERSRREAADTLTRLAVMIWETGYINLLEQARSALDRALDIDPGHELARELRALVAEKEGRYDDALEDLERLHRALPMRRDLELRLAVQLSRLGKTDRARDHLRSIAQRETTGSPKADGRWPVIVAAQEWARLERTEEKADEARRILEAASVV